MKICISCSKKISGTGWKCTHCGFEPPLMGGLQAFSPLLAEENIGFDPNKFTQLAEIEENNFWFYSRNLLIIWAIKKYFSYAVNLLEIGCGTGFVLSGIESAFPSMVLSGSDIYPEGLIYASRRLQKAGLFQMDARNIPFEEEFDVIGIFDVLEHIDEDSVVLSQINKSLSKSGGLLLTVPQHMFLWSNIDQNSRHVRRYSARELKSKVEGAGFKILFMTSFVSLLLPVMFLSRMKPKKNREGLNPELKIGSPLNTILKKILGFERIIIRSGISLPAGGSLLLVARKV